MTDYVELRGDDYLLRGSRVGLASVIMAWTEGLSPESIRDNFPTLTLEEVYGAITFYLANQEMIDSHLRGLIADFDVRRAEQTRLHAALSAKLKTALQSIDR